jgi:L-histidine Nalpha-methyltransferase
MLDKAISSAQRDFQAEVLAGLARRPRSISPRWFYDRRGSELFEQITELTEYYPTRAERQILAKYSGEVATLVGKGRVVFELGAGSSSKTRLLLSKIEPAAYVPIDISGEFLKEFSSSLAEDFDIPIHPLEADFTKSISLPSSITDGPRLCLFLGSTIGNLTTEEAVDVLRAIRRLAGEDGMLLIGVDRINERSVQLLAYADTQGVTAEFNKNLLRRINAELDADIPLDAFEHVVLWNDTFSRIEMHLQAERDVGFRVGAYRYVMKKGETIHTENSHKYGRRDAQVLLRAGGWSTVAAYTDDEDQFSVLVAK